MNKCILFRPKIMCFIHHIVLKNLFVFQFLPISKA